MSSKLNYSRHGCSLKINTVFLSLISTALAACHPLQEKISEDPEVVLINADGKDMEPVYRFSTWNLASAVAVRVDGKSYPTQYAENERVRKLVEKYLLKETLLLPYLTNYVKLENWNALTVTKDKLFICGNDAAKKNNSQFGNTWIFDLNTHLLVNGPSIPVSDPELTLLKDGRVLLSGGRNKSGIESDFSAYFDPQKLKIESCGKLLQARTNHSVIQLANGKIYIFGGEKNGGTKPNDIIDSVESLNSDTKTYFTVGKIFGRSAPFLVPFKKDQCLVVGGFFVLDNLSNDTRWVRDAEIFPEPSKTFQ